MEWASGNQFGRIPGITFRWTPDKVEAVLEDGKNIPLYTGMPIWNVFSQTLLVTNYRNFAQH